MALYYQVNEPNSHLERFDGMSGSAVAAMLNARGKTYAPISQAAWESQNPPGWAVYVFAGQSNSNYLAQKQAANLLADMGDAHSSAINTAVGSTAMSRWRVGGDLYETMLTSIAAEKVLHGNSWVAGMIFWQGESDVAAGSAAIEAWPGLFTAMVAGFRSAIQDPKRRVVFVQVTNTGGTDRDRLRLLQSQISIPYCTMVPTEGIHYGGSAAEGTEGGDHTDNAGYAIMEGRIVAALKALQ